MAYRGLWDRYLLWKLGDAMQERSGAGSPGYVPFLGQQLYALRLQPVYSLFLCRKLQKSRGSQCHRYLKSICETTSIVKCTSCTNRYFERAATLVIAVELLSESFGRSRTSSSSQPWRCTAVLH
jgi:hypothetical protein